MAFRRLVAEEAEEQLAVEKLSEEDQESTLCGSVEPSYKTCKRVSLVTNWTLRPCHLHWVPPGQTCGRVSLVSNWILRPCHLHWVTQDKPVEVSLFSNWILRPCHLHWVPPGQACGRVSLDFKVLSPALSYPGQNCGS